MEGDTDKNWEEQFDFNQRNLFSQEDFNAQIVQVMNFVPFDK